MVQQRRHDATRGRREHEPEGEPASDEHHPMLCDEREHVEWACAQRDADAHLEASLRDGKREHAVETHGGQHQCEAGER